MDDNAGVVLDMPFVEGFLFLLRDDDAVASDASEDTEGMSTLPDTVGHLLLPFVGDKFWVIDMCVCVCVFA